MQRINIFSTNHKIKPINILVDNLEHGFIDPFSKIIGCRERGVLCKPINKNP
jgi:hypothetical protein